MDAFLHASKAALSDLSSFNKVRVVLGNPTCDLDSAVCALAQGFCEYLNLEESARKHVAIIPVMNVPRKEFRIKTEVIYYLEYHQIDEALLTFRDGIDLKGLQVEPRVNLEVILVDHHNIPENDSFLKSCVIGIIDHRPRDPAWPWPGINVCLETVGSCATLVARNLLKEHGNFVDTRLASLLLGPILVDTCNFSKEADRATPLDIEVAYLLENAGQLKSSDRTQVFDRLLAAKSDISRLTTDDLMIRDLKIAAGIPFVGLPRLVENFLLLEDALGAIKRFAESRNVEIVVIIGLEMIEGKVLRDIAVMSLSSAESRRLRDKMIKALTSSTNPPLELVLRKHISQETEGCELFVYQQGNLRASRKQILPILRDIAAAEGSN